MSYRKVKQTNFYSGPQFLQGELSEMGLEFDVKVPSHVTAFSVANDHSKQIFSQVSTTVTEESPQHLVDVKAYSSFSKLVRIFANVLKFLHICKDRVRIRKDSTFVPEKDKFNPFETDGICRSQ